MYYNKWFIDENYLQIFKSAILLIKNNIAHTNTEKASSCYWPRGKTSEALGKSWGGIIPLSAGSSILMPRPFIRGITLPIRHMNGQ